MSAAFSAIDEAIVWTDPAGMIQWSNTQFDALVAKPRLKVLGSKLADLLRLEHEQGPLLPEEHPANLVLAARRPIEGFYGFRQAARRLILQVSGKYVPLGVDESAAVFVLRDVTRSRHAEEALKKANSKLSRNEKALMGLLSDLSVSTEKLKATQAQLIQAAKLESVGRLAAGAAHEVKNPLAILQQGLECLAAKVGSVDPSVAEILQEMTVAITKADRVIRGLLDFARLSVLDLEACQLAPLIEQAILLIRHLCDRSGVRIVKEFPDNLPPIRVDKNRMEQVFVNLFLNAVQAMPKGGELRITGYVTKLTKTGPQVGRRSQDVFRLGETVVVVDVEDTGSGIGEDMLPKIFDPFFTTRRDLGGSGLGLAMVRNIMEMHGGTVEIGNRAEGGVRATLRFKTGKDRSTKEERLG